MLLPCCSSLSSTGHLRGSARRWAGRRHLAGAWWASCGGCAARRSALPARIRATAAAPSSHNPSRQIAYSRAAMANALADLRRAAKATMLDGTTSPYKTPAAAGPALRGHPGQQLLDSDDVGRLGVRARPVDRDAPLKPGKFYFLVQIPRGAGISGGDDPCAPRKTWSVALHVGAWERLESI